MSVLSERQRAKVVASFERQQAMHSLGVSIADIGPGTIELHMPYKKEFSQQHGFVHGGIITTALDSSCGYAAFSLMPSEAAILTVEFKTSLLAPADGEQFIFCGKTIKSGRTLSFTQAEAFALKDGRKHLIATMNATMMAVYSRSHIQQ